MFMKKHWWDIILKLWLISIIVAISIFIIATIIVSKEIDTDFGEFAILMFLYSVCYSLPTFLVITLIHKTILKNLNKENRLSLSGIVIILMLITIFVVFDRDKYGYNENYSALSFSIIFTISIIISTIINKPSSSSSPMSLGSH